ncbi:MAG TPA: cysteine-rich CWC family protein [Polyangiaceae bacterium]|nr:cysteine-rich CWC family protein [Polyangiaceae bacterium]
MPAAPDPSRCPLCGAPNGCAVAAGGDGAACWCMSTTLPADVHARIPESARDKACVCAACARGTAETRRALRVER